VAIPIARCRICAAADLEPVLSLGDLPPVNSFLAGPDDVAAERRHPLAIAFCTTCSHVQLTHRLDPRDVFTDYIYFSSMSDTVLRWGVALAERYGRELGLAPSDLVAELASNDGAILRAFRGRARLVGIEPARNIAEVANRDGIPTRAEFFDSRQAASLRGELGPAKLIIARNVVAHVPEVIDFIAGAAGWLADDGVLHVEVPYVRDMVEALEFDTIYHEHLSYFSVTALDRLFREADLVLWDVERIPMHGGSLVARGRRTGSATAAVARFLAPSATAASRVSGPIAGSRTAPGGSASACGRSSRGSATAAAAWLRTARRRRVSCSPTTAASARISSPGWPTGAPTSRES
jgi:novobiocin biosynthesis protein NovU/D-mycarose 3-C-methyltransferase